MPRNLSDTQNQYLANNAIIGILLIELTNKTGSLEYYTDAPYDITIGSVTYSATDKILQITENTETAELQISSVNLVLSALSTNAITDYATPDMINKTVTIRRLGSEKQETITRQELIKNMLQANKLPLN